jgi:hypothetical protein
VLVGQQVVIAASDGLTGLSLGRAALEDVGDWTGRQRASVHFGSRV